MKNNLDKNLNLYVVVSVFVVAVVAVVAVVVVVVAVLRLTILAQDIESVFRCALHLMPHIVLNQFLSLNCEISIKVIAIDTTIQHKHIYQAFLSYERTNFTTTSSCHQEARGGRTVGHSRRY